MKFIKTKIDGAYIIETNKVVDERGFFVNSWNKKEFRENNLDVNLTECNIAFNNKKGTIRGLHYQIPPSDGAKLVRCIRGSIWDIAVDLRPNSKTFKQWFNVELNEENNKLNYIPPGCAHGYQTLEDNSEMLYLMSQEYDLKYERGLKYSDPVFNIPFPLEVSNISKKDLSWGFFEN
jgi:dTDP-4-dehydrorhamnose 3,5-epimerase